MVKVFTTFYGLDLWGIIADNGEEESEAGAKVKASERISIAKVEGIEIATIIGIMTTKSVEESEEITTEVIAWKDKPRAMAKVIKKAGTKEDVTCSISMLEAIAQESVGTGSITNAKMETNEAGSSTAPGPAVDLQAFLLLCILYSSMAPFCLFFSFVKTSMLMESPSL